MTLARTFAVLSAITFGLVASAAFAQMPPLPKPGPEHELLKQDAGTWDAIVEVMMAPGAPPATSKGVEVNTVGCGGLCVVTDFKSEIMGSPYHGLGVTTFDTNKKKYVGSWTDSMSTGLGIAESTYDAAAKTVTGWMEGPDMTGQVVRSKTVVTYADPDHRVMTMSVPGPDGKEVQVMKISYTRRK